MLHREIREHKLAPTTTQPGTRNRLAFSPFDRESSQ
jgi:hypothetical protein